MGTVSRIDISTVLSQNYMGGTYFTGYQSVCPVSAGTGALDYMVGRDEKNRLLIACPKNLGETGHTLLDTGFTTTVFDADSGIDEDIVVGCLLNQRIKIFSVKEQAVARSCEVELHLAAEATVEKLIVYRRDFVLYLFAVYQTRPHECYKIEIIELFLYDWTYNRISPDFSMDKPVCGCLRDNLSILMITFDEHYYRYYDFFEEKEFSIPMDYPGDLLCFSPVNTPVTGEGVVGLFDVDGSRKVYALDLNTLQWQNVNLVLNAQPVELETAYYNDACHLFVSAEADGEKKLYHASRRMDDTYWSTPLIMIPISGAITDFAVNKAEDARLGVIFDKASSHGQKANHPYGLLSSENTDIEYLTMGKDFQWNVKHAIVDSSQDHVFEYPCFCSQITFYDEKNAAWSGLEVELKAECATDVVVNNCTISLRPGSWVTVRTNLLGRLSILQRASELSVPDLTLKPKDTAGKEYCIIQYDKYTKKFQSLTAKELEQAALDDGQPLVPEEERGNCESIARMVRESFTPSNYNYHLFKKDSVIAHNTAGIYCAPADHELVFGQLCEASRLSMKIDFLESGGFRLSKCPENEALTQLAVTDGLWGSLRDLARSVVNNAVNLVSMAWESVKTVVKVTVEFVLDGIKQAASFIIRTVKDMLNSVMAVFDRFKMGFKQIFRWLGQLFSWNDILASKRQLDTMILRQLDHVGNMFVTSGQVLLSNMGYVIEASGTASANVSAAFPDGFDAAAKSQSIPPDSPFMEGQSNNVILNRLVDQGLSSQGVCCMAVFPDNFERNMSSLLDEIQECVTAFGTDVYDAINAKKDVFMNSFQTQEMVTVVKALGSILEELLALAQTPLGRIIQKMGILIEKLMKQIAAILQTELKIPIVTTLLKKVFGMPSITILDVISTVIAIPYTIICKLICGAPPVPANSWDSQSSMEHSGTLGNAYGFLKAGYILTGICVTCFYAFSTRGALFKPDPATGKSTLLFSVIPAITLLIWVCLNVADQDEIPDLPTTDKIGFAMSVISIILCCLVIYMDVVSMASNTRTDAFDGYSAFSIITAVFGLTSIVIGSIDLRNATQQQKWTPLDLVSQRNGILTGAADLTIALSGFFKPSTSGRTSNQEADDHSPDDIAENAEPVGISVDKILAIAGGIIGLAETACLFTEVGVKPFITSISPRGTDIPASGKVSITFDCDMDTDATKKGTITFSSITAGSITLAAGSWSGTSTYETNYSGLVPKTNYYLNIEDFQNKKEQKMEKDRYKVSVRGA